VRIAEWDGAPECPDGWPGVVPVADTDLDADGDGAPDTLVVAREAGGAWVFTDTDRNGFADRVLDVAPDGDDLEDSDDPGLLEELVRLVTGRPIRPN